MPVTMEDVRDALNPEEPDYAQAAQLGPDALPHLETLVRTAGSMLASKAVSLASMIPGPRSEALLQEAARSPRPELRVAAAAGARNLAGAAASDVLLTSLDDGDGGVRKVALNSVPGAAAATRSAGDPAAPALDPALQTKIEELAAADPEPYIRNLSRQVLDRTTSPP